MMRQKLFQLSVAVTLLLPSGLFASSQQCSGLTAVGGSCNTTDLPNGVNSVINALFTVAGAIAVIIMIIGGISYITSTGDASRIKRAKDTILYAIIGVIIVIVARAIVAFVLGQLF